MEKIYGIVRFKSFTKFSKPPGLFNAKVIDPKTARGIVY